MYLKILQNFAAWWRFKTSKAAVIKIPCILNSSNDNFTKPEKPSFVNLKKTKDSFEDSFPICVFQRCNSKHWSCLPSPLSCLTFEDFCVGLTFSHGPRDPKRFGREEKWGLGTRQREDDYRQAPVVQKEDSAIHQVNLYPLDSAFSFPLFIYWMEIYPIDSAIQLLNNWGLYFV